MDPALVLLACALFVLPPITMVRTTYRELLEGSPDEDLQAEVQRAVASVSSAFQLGVYHVRMTKLGRKVYVEIDFVVRPEMQVGATDRVRQELTTALDPLPHDVWLTVEFTADPSWGE